MSKPQKANRHHAGRQAAARLRVAGEDRGVDRNAEVNFPQIVQRILDLRRFGRDRDMYVLLGFGARKGRHAQTQPQEALPGRLDIRAVLVPDETDAIAAPVRIEELVVLAQVSGRGLDRVE